MYAVGQGDCYRHGFPLVGLIDCGWESLYIRSDTPSLASYADQLVEERGIEGRLCPDVDCTVDSLVENYVKPVACGFTSPYNFPI